MSKAKKINALYFDTEEMKLARVLDGGTKAEPKAYVHLEQPVEDHGAINVGLKNLNVSLCYKDNQEKLEGMEEEEELATGTILNARDAGELKTVVVKDGNLKLSILVPLKDGEHYWDLREYTGKNVDVIVGQGQVSAE